MPRISDKHKYVTKVLDYPKTKTAISLRHMPKKDEPHRRSSVTPVKMRPEEKKDVPVQAPDSFQRMEAAIRVASEHERNEPGEAHAGVTHSRHADSVADILYRAAAVVVGAIIVGVMTFVLPKIGLSQGKDTKPTIAMVQGKLKVPENGEKKILGSENFEKVELKDGILYISGLNYGSRIADSKIDLRDLRKQIKEKLGERQMQTFPEEIPLGIVGTPMDGRGVHLIYKSGILTITDKKSVMTGAADGSTIFTQDGAIFVAKDGSIVATTPTTLLLITSGYAKSTTYEQLFGAGNVPALKGPTIGKGNDDNYVDLRDAVLYNEKEKLKFQIQLVPFEVTVFGDDPSIGAR